LITPELKVDGDHINDHDYTENNATNGKNPQHKVITVRFGGDVKNADLFADFRLF